MPPQLVRVTKIAGNIGTQRPKLAPQTEVRSRQAITRGLLNSSLFNNYLNIPNVRYQGQGRDWHEIISFVMNNPHEIFDNIIEDVESNGEKTIVNEARKSIKELGKRLGRKDAKQEVAEFFESNTHGEFDPGQMLVHTLGAAHSVLYAGYDIDRLPRNTINNLKEAFRNGYVFLRAAEIVSKEYKESQDAGLPKQVAYYQIREAQERTRLQIFSPTSLEDEKFDAARLTAIYEITGSLIEAGSEANALPVLLSRIADGFNDIFPSASVEVEFRSDILNNEYHKPNSESFPNLSQNGKLQLLSKITEEPKSVEDVNQKMMGLPLLDKNHTLLGIIVLSLTNGSPGFPREIRDYAEKLKLHSSRMLENIVRKEQLEREVMTDPLTGLMNRRYFELRINQEFERSLRYKEPLSLLLLDIDFFKNINDTYGHPFGDKVLKELAQILRNSTRNEVDLPMRHGGEEFAIILPETSHEDAHNLAERIRKWVESYGFETDNGQSVPVTVSIGISTLGHHSNSDDLIEAADKRLYKAKENGRNRVM